MSLLNYRDVATAADAGAWTSWIHKTSAPAPGAAGRWADMSVGAGTPKYNAYVGTQYEFTPLVNSNNSAIYTGPNPGAGKARALVDMALSTTQGTQNTPLTFLLCDYLGFVPLIDGDSTDVQEFDNPAPLPRYADGAGVRAALVCAAPMAGNGTITVNYTNSAGASKSVTTGVQGLAILGACVNVQGATVVAGATSPFLPLDAGDTGIRSIQSATFPSAVGGLVHIVLVRPLATIVLRESNTWTEKNAMTLGVFPRIYDGAFLNYFYMTSGTGSPATVRGQLTFATG